MTRKPDILLGLVIGGTNCAAVVGFVDGRIAARAAASTPKGGAGEVIDTLDRLARVALEQESAPRRPVAIGVSFGGSWDSRNETTRTPPNLPSFGEIPLRKILEGKYQIPVAVENDANATALAEHRWGAGRGCDDMAFFTMGTGIGAGLILAGALYRGRNDNAGEFGHAVLLPNGPLCSCGKRGCLEAFASGTAIGRMGTERYGEPVDGVTVCRRAREGDRVAQGIVDEAAEWMGLGIANFLHTLNLERIVLGTLAVSAGDLFLAPIRAAAQRNCWPDIWEGVQILPAGLGEDAQLCAALAVAAGIDRGKSIG